MQSPSFSIYDASAGSGKTYTLVKEYLKIILSSPKNDAYRNILAITFTNKAVHEMKSRIVGSLSEFAKDEPSAKAIELMEDLSRETSLSIIKIKTKSQNIIKHLIHNYAAFDISTIDKFTHKVIRAFAHDLNLPMTFEVTLDTENLLIEAVDAIIAQAGQDETLTNLLVDFTMEKTDDDKSWDVSREILETGRLVLNENNRNEILHFQHTSIEEFVAVKKKMSALCADLEKENQQAAEELLDLIDKNGIDLKSFSRGTFPNHLESIRDGKFNPRNKTFHEFEDIAINKTAKDRALIENIIPELLHNLDKIYKKFEKRDFYKAFLKNITPLSLLNTVSNELAKIQSEQNVLSISEFNAIIHREIQNQPAPFIYERLGERYRHFFIDEFQDTSEMQWQNLIPLIDNALSGQDDLGNKGTLMIVGDPKQSIYRWRGGKAEQFIELSKDTNPFNNPDKEIRHLNTNYRSYSEIIDFNNAFFKLISTEFSNEDYKDLYENHSFQNSNAKKGGYVNISFLPIIEKNDVADEEEVVEKNDLYVLATLNTIQKVLREGFEYKDIVILTRKRDQGIAIATYLTEQNIPLLSSETLMIQNATEVRLIVHLLKYLNNSADLEAKANFLHFLAVSKAVDLPIHDFIAKGMAQRQENDFEKWLLTLDLSLSFEGIRKKSLYEAVEIIISKFLPAQGNAYVQYFLDIVLERDIRNQAGIADFLAYWDKNGSKFSIPSPEGKNAIRIMTIHKSKGLEFPVVIMPFAEEDYSRKPKDKLWLDTENDDLGLPKALIDNSTAVEGFGENASLVFNLKKQEELLDNINVLYVALTRAEEQLFVISQSMKEKKDGEFASNMASFFIKYLINEGVYEEEKLEYEFGDKAKLSQSVPALDEVMTIPMVSEVLNPKNIKIAQKEALMWGTHQQEAISYGNVIHEILAFVKDKSDVELSIVKALENGLITFDQKEIVYNTLQEIVNHAELNIYFDGSCKILNEQTIVQKEGRILKPDRIVFTKNKEAYLLDYKTGAANVKYKQQIQEYQLAIEDLGYRVLKNALAYIGTEIDVVNL
ncbi:UvrD-helicase domain-containing protein [Flavobacterium sp. Fl-77]|uniref:DNA 3'-5' helicase n=1 Tax=Flavobacterium flavipigmentatum TaxID=2893884 RepID=A0AAJ2SCI8_9FLAO|nr:MULTISPECIES: UvrD-helicase domain-containing protein [unclassified Flavobacterium]MDX6180710.1 UvrD-helicase domain-containing protein [Flavobacterium sp. Fl-33]MDX6184310.1 UvrD-helicase domain-containing protein [Flavobacterium sp. Fl-77]UFH39420.1 UvrD-helicase domain-containing protein [Flavobacterium sp. F-70]